MGATVVGETILFLGGWITTGTSVGTGPTDVVDVFGPKALVSTATLPTSAFWAGAVTIDGTGYVVGNEKLIEFDETGKVTKTSALPKELVGKSSLTAGGGVPGAHVEGNGVAVGSVGCFYSYKPNAVYCYNTKDATWTSMPCTVMHKGGIIAAVGNTIAVAGGFDEVTSRPTGVIDVFQIN
jgi:hypothetical protein